MRRGQAMVLGALFLLLLTLMVLVTLSVGQRTRERIEAQLAADAAAYSNAVVLARTLNEVALINRTRASLLVVHFGVQSLISWSGHHRSNLDGTDKALTMAMGPYAAHCGVPFDPLGPCSCAELGLIASAQGKVHAEQAKIAASWEGLDTKAADYASDLLIAAANMNESSFEAFEKYHRMIDDQFLTGIITAKASDTPDGPELTVAKKGDQKSRDEAKDQPGCDSSGSLYCTDNFLPVIDILRPATMGARGWAFTTARKGSRKLVRDRLEWVVGQVNAGAAIEPGIPDGDKAAGGSGVGADKEAAQQKTITTHEYTWGEDHGGTLKLAWPSQTGCIPSAGTARVVDGWVKSSQLAITGTQHKYAGSSEPSGRHQLQFRSSGSGRSSWPWAFEYNFHELSKAANDFGQPKQYAIVERDFEHRKTPYPWDLFFNFHFASSGPGAELDLGSPKGIMTKRDGLRRQIALGSAIVYYHRPAEEGHPDDSGWKEPPNLWNPFWRATLYAPDDDLPKYLDKAGYPEHADAIKRLLKAGLAGTL